MYNAIPPSQYLPLKSVKATKGRDLPCWGNADAAAIHRRLASRLQGMVLSNMATSIRGE